MQIPKPIEVSTFALLCSFLLIDIIWKVQQYYEIVAFEKERYAVSKFVVGEQELVGVVAYVAGQYWQICYNILSSLYNLNIWIVESLAESLNSFNCETENDWLALCRNIFIGPTAAPSLLCMVIGFMKKCCSVIPLLVIAMPVYCFSYYVPLLRSLVFEPDDKDVIKEGSFEGHPVPADKDEIKERSYAYGENPHPEKQKKIIKVNRDIHEVDKGKVIKPEKQHDEPSSDIKCQFPNTDKESNQKKINSRSVKKPGPKRKINNSKEALGKKVASTSKIYKLKRKPGVERIATCKAAKFGIAASLNKLSEAKMMEKIVKKEKEEKKEKDKHRSGKKKPKARDNTGKKSCAEEIKCTSLELVPKNMEILPAYKSKFKIPLSKRPISLQAILDMSSGHVLPPLLRPYYLKDEFDVPKDSFTVPENLKLPKTSVKDTDAILDLSRLGQLHQFDENLQSGDTKIEKAESLADTIKNIHEKMKGENRISSSNEELVKTNKETETKKKKVPTATLR